MRQPRPSAAEACPAFIALPKRPLLLSCCPKAASISGWVCVSPPNGSTVSKALVKLMSLGGWQPWPSIPWPRCRHVNTRGGAPASAAHLTPTPTHIIVQHPLAVWHATVRFHTPQKGRPQALYFAAESGRKHSAGGLPAQGRRFKAPILRACPALHTRRTHMRRRGSRPLVGWGARSCVRLPSTRGCGWPGPVALIGPGWCPILPLPKHCVFQVLCLSMCVLGLVALRRAAGSVDEPLTRRPVLGKAAGRKRLAEGCALAAGSCAQRPPFQH